MNFHSFFDASQSKKDVILIVVPKITILLNRLITFRI